MSNSGKKNDSWKHGVAKPPPELEGPQKLIEEYRRLRETNAFADSQPSREQMRKMALAAMRNQAAQAIRNGASYDDVLENVKNAMNAEVCQQIHDS